MIWIIIGVLGGMFVGGALWQDHQLRQWEKRMDDIDKRYPQFPSWRDR